MQLENLKLEDLIFAQNKMDGGPGFWTTKFKYQAHSAAGLFLTCQDEERGAYLKFTDYWFFKVEEIEETFRE